VQIRLYTPPQPLGRIPLLPTSFQCYNVDGPPQADRVSVNNLAITGSRVMMCLRCWEGGRHTSTWSSWLLVGDWSTGAQVRSLPIDSLSSHALFTLPTQVLNLSANESMVIREGTRVTFLDEFRMMVFAPDVPEFTLFDTHVPPGHPVNSRRFRIPLRYRNWFPSVHVDSDRCLGTPDREVPLTTDPTQAVLVVKLTDLSRRCVLLIVRIQTLIEHECSMDLDACVPWDVWRRGVAVMEVPISHRGGPTSLVVQGVHVILAKMYTLPGTNGHHPRLRVFDFSQRGWGTLPPWDEIDRAERRVLFEDGRDLFLRGDDDSVMGEWGFNTLGDDNFMHQVGSFRRWRSDCKLMSWEAQSLWFGRCATRLDADLR